MRKQSKEGSWTGAAAAAVMFSWVKQEQGGRNKDGEMYQTVTEGLQTLYTKKLLPLEETYLFHDFHSPALEAADFQSKPMVLLVGQYSTGKTTFIRYSMASAAAAGDGGDGDVIPWLYLVQVVTSRELVVTTNLMLLVGDLLLSGGFLVLTTVCLVVKIPLMSK